RPRAQLRARGHGEGRDRSGHGVLGGPRRAGRAAGARGDAPPGPPEPEPRGAGVRAGRQIPTTENILAYLWPRLEAGMPPGARLHRLRLHEDPTFYVDYFGGAGGGA